MRSVFAVAALAATAAAQTQNLTATLQGNSNLTTLTGLIGQYPELVSTLSSLTNITVLAPSNSAISKFLNSSSTANATLGNSALVQAILSYHVINGTVNSSQITTTPTFARTLLTSPLLTNVTGGQTVEALNSSGALFVSGLGQQSRVTQADIAFTGGLVHVIDTILNPPANISTTAIQYNLTAVAGALTTAGLVQTLDTARDLTVFAPSNDAFGAISNILRSANASTLTTVLGYHVINGSVLYSTNLSNTTVTTFGGQNLTVTVSNGSVFVNQARVIRPNVLVANGVVHVIDSVLNPGNATAAPTTNGTAFPNATSDGTIPYTSGVPSGTAAIPSPSSTARTSSSSAGAAAQAAATGFVGAGLLFAGALMAL